MRHHVSNIALESTDLDLMKAFYWAKDQALRYVFEDRLVGPFYEAALPGRQAFCMRDVAHQSWGAQVLGLALHTKNMLSKFAENISESRDWCTFWEMNENNLAAPEDYDSDESFWYNLPSNFDILDCCYRQFLWTGDVDYRYGDAFRNFYERTVSDYVASWDVNGDGMLEHLPSYGRRGIATYNEGIKDPLIGGDMIAAQYAGYLSYSRMKELDGDAEQAKWYLSKATELKRYYEEEWWDATSNHFFSFRKQDGSFETKYAFESNFLPLYFELIAPGVKLDRALDALQRNETPNIESETYVMDICFKYQLNQVAYHHLFALAHPERARREYPEVSFCVVGACVTGICGVRPDANTRMIETMSHVADDAARVRVSSIPVLTNEVTVEHCGHEESSITNEAGSAFRWRACFAPDVDVLLVDGQRVHASKTLRPNGTLSSFVEILIEPGQTRSVQVPNRLS